MTTATLIRNDSPPTRFELTNFSLQRPDGGVTTFSATILDPFTIAGRTFRLEHSGTAYEARNLKFDKEWVTGSSGAHSVSGELSPLSL